jgi:hypothetical protein
MSNYRNVLRPLATGFAVLAIGAASAFGGIGISSEVAHAAPMGPTSHQAKAHPHKVAKAEHTYVTHLGPSKAWRHAGKAERANAKRAYLAEFGSWQNGCLADLKHAYQGKTGKGGLHNVQPWLPVSRLKVPGRDIYLGEYTDGICGD